MKKAVILFLVFAALLQAAYAETKIFSGKLITDTDVNVDGTIFRFKYDENTNKIFVQNPIQT